MKRKIVISRVLKGLFVINKKVFEMDTLSF